MGNKSAKFGGVADMKSLIVLAMFAFSITSADEQESLVERYKVSNFQRLIEGGDQDDRVRDQLSAQAFYNGHLSGFVHGFFAAMHQYGLDVEKLYPAFSDCLPRSDKLFYSMMAATGEEAEFTVGEFATIKILESCQPTIDRLSQEIGGPTDSE